MELKSSAEFVESFEKLSLQIIKERNSGYKYTSRGAIVKALDQIRAEIAEDGNFIEDSVFHGSSDDMKQALRRQAFHSSAWTAAT